MDGSLTLPHDRLPPHGSVNEDVRRCVVHQEWLERIVPRTVFWALFGTAILMLLSRYCWHVTGGVLIGAIAALIVARLAVAMAVAVVLWAPGPDHPNHSSNQADFDSGDGEEDLPSDEPDFEAIIRPLETGPRRASAGRLSASCGRNSEASRGVQGRAGAPGAVPWRRGVG